MIIMFKVNLDLISDVDMYLLFEKVMGDSVPYISKRYCKANNKHVTSYDPKKSTKHITYFDENNLYAYVMSKSLSMVGFKWFDPIKFNLDKNGGNSSRDCVSEVDLEYSQELNKLHNDYPLAPKKSKFKRKMLFYYQLKIADGYDISIGNVKKIVLKFFDKEKYVPHYKNLQHYLKLGLKTKKIIAN